MTVRVAGVDGQPITEQAIIDLAGKALLAGADPKDVWAELANYVEAILGPPPTGRNIAESMAWDLIVDDCFTRALVAEEVEQMEHD